MISVTRAEHPGGWADRLVEACDTRFTSRTFGDLPHWERSAPGRLGRWRCHELCCPDVLQIRRISVPGVGVLAIRSQQRPWHPYRESKLGARETSTAICPQPWQKSQKSLVIALYKRFRAFGWVEKISSDLSARARGDRAFMPALWKRG